MPFLVHGEVTDAEIDLFDREAVFIDRVMQPLRKDMPELKVVFEHITTSDAAAYVAESGGPIAATITAHHLLYNRNEIFKGGIRPHYYCLPVLKRETHRQAALHAMELYAQAFEQAGALDQLEAFASFNGPDFYQLPRNSGSITLVREDWQMPAELPFADTSIVPLNSGETLHWKMRTA